MANQPLETYIKQNRQTYSRFAIDQQLLANGYDPAEVDAAWLQVEGKTTSTKARRSIRLPLRSFFLVSSVLGVLVIALWAVLIYHFPPTFFMILNPTIFLVARSQNKNRNRPKP